MELSRRSFAKLGAGAVGASLFMQNALSGAQDEKVKAAGDLGLAGDDYDLPKGDHEVIRKKTREVRQRDPRPNVLWIFTDQQQWDLMSCAGNKHVNTPQIDRLAQVGVRFENAYCPSPVCGPSRGSMVTGFMPHLTGVRHNGDTLSEKTPTMGEVLRKAGYRTWWSGKWHLPEPRLYVDGDVRGFHNLPLPKGLPKSFLGDCQDMLYAGMSHDWLVWHAALFPQPWFHAVSLINPHDICFWFKTNRDWAIGYQLDEYENLDRMPPSPDNTAIPNDEPEALSAGKGARKERPDSVWRAYNADYAAMTETVDRAVGMVLEGARKGGWLENTLIIFTSDHGDGGGSHQWSGKLSCYEEAAKVPMIIVPPGGMESGRVDTESLVSGLDIPATVYDYAGVESPPETHGRSLRGVVEGGGKADADYVVMHIAPGRRKDPEQSKIEGRMVRSSRYKYVTFNWGKHPEQLFDLENDPGELRNLAPDNQYADVIKEHRAMLEEWKKGTGDPFNI